MVAAAAVIAIIVVVVGLASLGPKSKPASVNEPPVAEFASYATNLTVVLNGSASHDPDGSIANYSWTFGDNTGSYGMNVTHTYNANGTYNVKLTVTDNGGATNTTSKELTMTQQVTPVMNKQPVAVISVVDIENLTVSLSGADSQVFQGKTLTNYAWTFGDNSVGTGVAVTHNYSANGTYKITLTVTDNSSASNSTSVTVKVSNPTIREPPTAVIKVESIVNRTVVLNGTESRAQLGSTIVQYTWDFGDGTNATGPVVTHTYAANGTYTITLTVKDNHGLTGNATVTVTVSTHPTPPPPHPEGPPGLLHAIEIHMEKADRNGGLRNSLDHLQINLDRWLEKMGLMT